MMSIRILGFVALLGGVLAIPAEAADLRYRQSGVPAFKLHLPVGWTQQVDETGAEVITASDRSALLQLSFAAFSGALDQRAKNVMTGGAAATQTPHGMPATFAGQSAQVYQSGVYDAAGAHKNIRLYLIRLDPDHVASALVVTIDDITDAQKAALRDVIHGTALVTH
jgi:hypothetical protein